MRGTLLFLENIAAVGVPDAAVRASRVAGSDDGSIGLDVHAVDVRIARQ